MRNPRLIETLVLVSAGLAFSDGIASKIICEHSQLDDLPWVEGHLESADVVLLGTVISAEFPEPPESEEPTPKTEQEWEAWGPICEKYNPGDCATGR